MHAARLALLGALLVSSSASNAEPKPGFTKAYTADATGLRKWLLDGKPTAGSNPPPYDKLVAPTSDRKANYSKAGTNVELQVRFFKVESVKAAEGNMRLKVWYRLQWVDQRLQWEKEKFGNVTEINFAARAINAPEDTEIWVPDLQPYNSNEPIEDTLDASLAIVYSDGTVFWSRPGDLDVMCKFSGLVAFPYDVMSCAIEIGGWGMSGGFQGVSLMGSGYAFSNQEETAGSSYQEYTIDSINVKLATYFYDCCPSQPWPNVIYRVFLQRSKDYYTWLVVIPSIMLTYISFGVFFTSYAVGERLSFGITLLLAAEVTKVVISTFVPVCGELLWVDVFSFTCSVFNVSSLVESMIVLYLAYHQEEHLLPVWFVRLWHFVWAKVHRTDEDKYSLTNQHPDIEPCAGAVYRQLAANGSEESANGACAMPMGDEGGRFSMGEISSRIAAARPVPLTAMPVQTDDDTPPLDAVRRLLHYERMFFDIDPESRGFVKKAAVVRLFETLLVSLDQQACAELVGANDKEADGHFFRREFVELCVETLSELPPDFLDEAVGNFVRAESMLAKRFSTHWIAMSRKVDQVCRVVIPIAYSTCLLFVFNARFADPYESDPSAAIFMGLGDVSYTAVGVVESLIPIFVALACLLAWLMMRHVAKTQRLVVATPTMEDMRKRTVDVGAEKDAAGSEASTPARARLAIVAGSPARMRHVPASSTSNSFASAGSTADPDGWSRTRTTVAQEGRPLPLPPARDAPSRKGGEIDDGSSLTTKVHLGATGEVQRAGSPSSPPGPALPRLDP